MHYVMSDIHGHRTRFDSIMDQIELKPNDKLFILGDVIDLAAEGLRRRGRGEEKFVQNLYSRAAHLMSPARVQVEGLESGVPLEYYINDYSKLH